MEIKAETTLTVTPADLAATLAGAEPKLFGAVWLEFANLCTDSKLDSFAEVMAEDLGSNKRLVLEKLLRFTNYYIGQRDRQRMRESE